MVDWKAFCGPARGPGNVRGGFVNIKYKTVLKISKGTTNQDVGAQKTEKEFIDLMFARGKSKESDALTLFCLANSRLAIDA